MAFESLRTTFLAGLGLAVITADQARRAVQGFVEAGRITAEQAETLVKDLMNAGREQSKSVRDAVAEAVQSAMGSMDLADGRQTRRLETRLDALEQRLAVLEAMLLAKPASDQAAQAQTAQDAATPSPPEDRRG